jgi:DNA-binding MarR family transcriptional regulator
LGSGATQPPAHFDGELGLGRLENAPGFLLRRANVVFRLHYAKWFADTKLGITPVMGGMMILIDDNPGVTQIELARLLKIEGSTLWQTVTRLIELGYVQRYRPEHDKRAYALQLSRTGRLALGQIETGMRLHQNALLEALTPEERTLLKDMLLRIIRHGEAVLNGPNAGAPS